MDSGKKWLVDLNIGKTQLVLFDGSNNTGSIDVKMDRSVLEEKPSFKMLGLTFFSKLGWGCYTISIAASLEPLSQLFALPFSSGKSTHYSDRLLDFSVTICRCYKNVYANSSFPRTARLWDSLPIECFPLTFDLNGLKSRVNRHLLTVCSF